MLPAAMAATNVDKQGKEWNNLFKWLSTLQVNSLKKTVEAGSRGQWDLSHLPLREQQTCPTNCPLLKDLNLKLVCGPPPAATPPATTPAPVAPVASPSGHLAMADDSSAANLSGQTTAPSGLVATFAEVKFESDKEFCWEGDESSLDYTPPSACNSNNNAALNPPCLCVTVEHILCAMASVSHTAPCSAVDPLHSSLGTNSHLIILSKHLQAIIARLAHASIHPCPSRRFMVADSSTIDHMIPDKSAFISYKMVTNLQVGMGNNLYLLVLGHGTVIISLNGQRILLQNVLHVPGFVVPLSIAFARM